MTERKVYKAPPITEAVIEIRFASKLKSADLLKARKSLLRNYSSSSVKHHVNVHVNMDTETFKKDEEDYFQLSSVDMTQICLLKKELMCVSQLAPYTSWEDFLSRFERDYNLLIKSIGIREIIRIGVRYLNRIDIPNVDTEVHEDEYLNIYPKYPECLGLLDGYSINQLSKVNHLKSYLRINSAVVPSPVVGYASITFDQDFGREIDLSHKVEWIVSFLNKVREEKNKVFEACITDKTRELFQK